MCERDRNKNMGDGEEGCFHPSAVVRPSYTHDCLLRRKKGGGMLVRLLVAFKHTRKTCFRIHKKGEEEGKCCIV